MNSILKIMLAGGTGNQLFQLANAMSLSVLYEHPFILQIKNGSRPYSLNWWGLDFESKYFFNERTLSSTKLKSTDRKFFFKKYSYFDHEYFQLPIFKNRTVINGYFQSIYYFEDIEEILRKFLEFPSFGIPRKFWNSYKFWDS